jgi:hypothetical protein
MKPRCWDRRLQMSCWLAASKVQSGNGGAKKYTGLKADLQ